MIWDFIQNEVLGMKWLNRAIGSLLSLTGLDIESRIGASIQFFLYDVIKITVLLCILIFIVSYIQSYFPPERSRRIMGRFHGFWANLIAALLGTVTPFCSCSSIPLFMGFTAAGLSVGTTFSFLISSPMVDLGSLVLLMSIFGWRVAIVYVVLGLVIAVIGGTVLQKLGMDSQVEDFVKAGTVLEVDEEVESAIIQRQNATQIQTLSLSKGMKTLREDGWAKVFKGVTSVKEIRRVTEDQ